VEDPRIWPKPARPTDRTPLQCSDTRSAGRHVQIVDFRTRESSRSVDARPMAARAKAKPHHGFKICQPADATVSPGRPKHSRGPARECEETSGKRPEPLGKVRRLTGATQPAYRRSGGRDCQRGARSSSASKAGYSRFRPAQQPEQKAADGSRTQGDALCNGCQREQDDGEAPKRLVVFPVSRIPVHQRGPVCPCSDDRTRHVSISRTIFRTGRENESVRRWRVLIPRETLEAGGACP
jgi:hypothetical protein